jgi:hypothetical protein
VDFLDKASECISHGDAQRRMIFVNTNHFIYTILSRGFFTLAVYLSRGLFIARFITLLLLLLSVITRKSNYNRLIKQFRVLSIIPPKNT